MLLSNLGYSRKSNTRGRKKEERTRKERRNGITRKKEVGEGEYKERTTKRDKK